MKTRYILAISLSLLLYSCKKHVVKPVDQLSLLPAATQTGANTFGCLINGQAFVPKNRNILEGPDLQCNYIYTDGGYGLTVACANKYSRDTITDVVFGTDSLAIVQGESLQFKTFVAGNAFASYFLVYDNGLENQYSANNTISGQLIITKLDTIKQIVSGTFYFDAINESGSTVKVTNGRFDMLYTR